MMIRYITKKPVLITKKNHDDNMADLFVEEVEKAVHRAHERFKIPVPIIISAEEEKTFRSSEKCWLCETDFIEKPKDYKVRDHCHMTCKFRGAAHNSCNLKFKQPDFIPVYFHNLSGYDAHLFVKSLGKDGSEVTCIPCNEEKYISFDKKIVVGQYVDKNGEEKDLKMKIRFVDTMKFMLSSLERLAQNLGPDQLKSVRKQWPKDEDFEMLTRKGVYPYDYMDCLEKLDETQLPPKHEFYSKLTGDHISDENYNTLRKSGLISK